MVDNNENILVEFDYQNISVIDPNKVIDSEGKVKDRLIKQEDLVYYANLECSVTPRTKLALGVPQNETVKTISVGKINFLNPGFKQFLDESYVDEITGKGSLKGLGINQPKVSITKNPDVSEDYYVSQSIMSEGKFGAVDTGLLGINQINIEIGESFLPVITITMEDVKGRALFEAGNDSPYSAFFQLPYPVFYLTVKGYLGKAIRLPLMLHTFTSSFDPSTHNFRINTTFYTYKYTILSQVDWYSILAVPAMYRINIQKQETTSNNSSGASTKTTESYSSLGLQKMKELYTEYKAKGLIDDEFPEITVLELKERLNTLITNIEEQFKKKNLNVLNELEKYLEDLNNYQSYVYLYSDSWARKYLDFENVFIKTDTEKTVLYKFKPEFSDVQKQTTAIEELTGIITKNNNLLLNNSAIGKDISVPVTTKVFFTPASIADINITETYKKRTGLELSGLSTSEVYSDYKKTLNNEITTAITLKDYSGLMFFTGLNSFDDIIKKINEKYLTKKEEIENKLTKEIQEQFANPTNGLGFQPTIRNVLAVFFAQGEAFLRLMDDVHTKAWDLRNDENRRRAVFSLSTTVPSVDLKNSQTDSPIYPWPQIISEELVDGSEKYVLKYPGDDSLAVKLSAYVPEIWPEVQFVEEFLRGFSEKEAPKFSIGATGNDLEKPRRFSFNAAEFTITNQVYQNTEEVKFFFEIYERMFLNSFYTKLNRDSVKQNNIYNSVAESETTNIVEALGQDNPFLTKKIKEYNINSQIYGSFLRHISNGGEGLSWQNFIRGVFNTTYVANDVATSFKFYKDDILLQNIALPNVGLNNDEQVVNYFGGNKINDEFDLTDLYPLTNKQWCNDYLANGKGLNSNGDIFKTSDTLQYDKSIKLIRNKDLAPIVNFNYKKDNFNQTLDLGNLKTFYKNRKIKEQYTTEGNIEYVDYDGKLVENQTTSMFNTPYFANAIQKGVFDFRYSLVEKSPYKAAAYLFLNSLPLSTLRDRFKVFNANGSESDVGYMIPSFKKFGAVHKLPYAWVLKYGSIWHRYKKWKQEDIDILDGVWDNFDYVGNYDPYLSASTTIYQIVVDNEDYDLILDYTSTAGLIDKTNITTGFYPKTLDDFNVFFQGKKIFSESSQIVGTCYVDGTFLEVVSVNTNTLGPGFVFSGANIENGTTIISQFSGTTGGPGLYYVTPNQTYPFVDPTQSLQSFVITNQSIGGFNSQSIQSALNANFRMILSPTSVINKSVGFDLGDLNRSLTILPWSCYSLTPDSKFLYPLPSLGYSVNQTSQECFNIAGGLSVEVSNNPAVHNGNVRLFWKAPNYGYFDNNKLTKPQPDEYIREVFNNEETQQNFGIFGDPEKYTKISELFTTFSYDVLDKFEEQFLLFSTSVYDFESNLEPKKESNTDEEIYENFQGLMREMFKTPIPTVVSGPEFLQQIVDNQKTNMQKILETFMEYNVVFKYGNPTNFDKKLFYTFSNQFIEDPYTWGGYVQNSPFAVPSAGGSITLSQSKTQYPLTWKSLETYVGFSEIPELEYKDTGSYITDFFIDLDVEFSESNIELFHPIIKLYATQKLEDPTMNYNKFFSLMDSYIQKGEEYLNLILDSTLVSTRAKLPNVKITPSSTGVKFSEYNGDLVRLDVWEKFKGMNDSWISGANLKTKTLFEDILIVDRASRDVGQRIFVDIFKLKTDIETMSYSNNMLGIIETIFVGNNFKSFILPSYANFYNVQDVSKNPTPRPEGSLEFANSLFGTFLNVDYRDTTSKYLAIYAHTPSQYVDMKTNTDYRFRDDAFDLRRASDNPLIENLDGKTDWDKSNKVVGFNVDFGPQNQQVFKQIDIAQDPGKPTSESLEMLNQMANQYRNRGGASQSVSLYNIYKNRSYKCSIDMIGCAMIQPMMYFNLRHIPMFSGPYMITNVTHRISENGFDTFIEGQRQPFYSIPKVETLLQSLSTKILTTIKERLKEETATSTIQNTNNNVSLAAEATNTVNNVQPVVTSDQDCAKLLNSIYTTFTTTESVNTSISLPDAVTAINTEVSKLTDLTATEKTKFADFIFIISYKKLSNNSLVTTNNNYASLDLTNDVGPSSLFEGKYYCAKDYSYRNTPFVSFASFQSYLSYFISKYKAKVVNLSSAERFSVAYANDMAKSSLDTFPIEKSRWSLLTVELRQYEQEQVANALNYLKNNEPKPEVPAEPNPSVLVEKKTFTILGSPPLLEEYEVNINPDGEKRKIFFAEMTVKGESTPICVDGSTQKVNVTNYIQNSGQTFVMTSINMLDEIGCGGSTPQSEYQGTYYMNFTFYTIKINPDGSAISGTDYYKTLPLTFSF